MRLQPHQTDHKQMFLAMVAAAILILVWQVVVEAPKREQMAAYKVEEAKRQAALKQKQAVQASNLAAEDGGKVIERDAALATGARVKISSDRLHGSINVKGLRIDDLTLANYHETVDPSSPEVELLSPSNTEKAYFAHIGWTRVNTKLIVPDAASVWSASSEQLSPDVPVTFTWQSPQNITFKVIISLDEHYMFSIEQHVINASGESVDVVPFALLNRRYKQMGPSLFILHEGPIAVLDEKLTEIDYQTLEEDGAQKIDNARGWLGFTDKYWLAAFIPEEGTFTANFNHYVKNGITRYQAEYLGPRQQVAEGQTAIYNTRLFAGAKELDILDAYAEGQAGDAPILFFDRAVDFGWLYFLTKPMFMLLDYFYGIVGNFGVAILILTLLIKLVMFPLANKSYIMSSRMRALQPRMKEIQQTHAEDRVRLQQELMKLYREEKVNPASGCLPLLIQFPVFFALYKVLFVTIEMRHAPFIGWIQDLSAKDPSNLFTLFGLIEWAPPDIMHLGILPILMCISMVIQMRQQPSPTDPTQAKVMKLMPYFFLFFFSSMPAGLVLYWTFSNVLSILQQAVISKKHGPKGQLKT